jgi:hypothetical protein
LALELNGYSLKYLVNENGKWFKEELLNMRGEYCVSTLNEDLQQTQPNQGGFTVATVLDLMSMVALFGGIIVAFLIAPSGGDFPGFVAFMPSVLSVVAGLVQCVIFSAISKIITILIKIEANTRKAC